MALALRDHEHHTYGAYYGRLDIHELADTLACGILPDVVIDWARVVRDE